MKEFIVEIIGYDFWVTFLVGLMVFAIILSALVTPKKVNSIVGIRSKSTMKNQKCWRYAHTYGALWMLMIPFIWFFIMTPGLIYFNFKLSGFLLVPFVVLSTYGVLEWRLKCHNYLVESN